ncbi:MAG: hypothetical protein IKN81_06745, partial [Oscillospiraceae bacterium]|nr:hypothetical protein [Oscillospiraceae bacterium]
MRNRARRVLSILLSLAMVLGCVDVSVFASDDPPTPTPVRVYGLDCGASFESDGVIYKLTKVTQPEGNREYIFIPGATLATQYLTALNGVIVRTDSDDAARVSVVKTAGAAAADFVRGTLYSGGLVSANGKVDLTGTVYAYAEIAFRSMATVTLTKDGAPWSGLSDVTLYQDGRYVATGAELTDEQPTGVYSFGWQPNGRYQVYVAGEQAAELTVSAKVSDDADIAAAVGEAAEPAFQLVDSADDGDLTFDKALNFTTLSAKVRLDGEEVSAGAIPGAVSIMEKHGESYTALVTDQTGVHAEKAVLGSADATIVVGGSDTGVAASADAVVDFYNMTVTIHSPNAAQSDLEQSEVALYDEDGKLGQILTFQSFTPGEGDNQAVFSAVMRQDGKTYRVFLDGQDTGKTLACTGEGDTLYKTDLNVYTVKIPAKLNGSVWENAQFVVSNGTHSYALRRIGDEYVANVIAKMGDEGEEPYTITALGVVDQCPPETRQFTADTVADAAAANAEYCTVQYRNYSKNATGYELSGEPFRTQIVRKGSATVAPANAEAEGLTFAGYSESNWLANQQPNALFDFGTPITAAKVLYAQYDKPSVRVNEFIRSTKTGAISGAAVAADADVYYRMPNLTVTGDALFRSAELKLTNVSRTYFIDSDSVTLTQGSGLPLATDGGMAAADNGVVSIVFKTPQNANQVQDWLRANVIVCPKRELDFKVEVTVSDGVVTAAKATSVPQSAYQLASGATRLTGSSSGATLSGGLYYVDSNVTYSNSSAGGSGLTIADGSTVYLYLKKGVTLTARGANGSGRTGGGAGINLPAGSVLVLLGEGSVNATGGNAGSATSGGSNAKNARIWNDGVNQMVSGSGGDGGNGGGGAGAGIGGSGGYGGSGGSGGDQRQEEASKTHDDGFIGGSGGNGGNGGASGTLYVLNSVRLTATGGSAGSTGSDGARRNGGAGFGSSGYWANDAGSGWNASYGAGSGGPGGGGGAGG